MNNKEILDEEEYTISESSQFLKITSQTVSNYLRNGNLKGIKKGPKNKWYISGFEIKKLMRDWKMI